MYQERPIDKFLEHAVEAEEYIEKIRDYLGEHNQREQNYLGKHMGRNHESLTWEDADDATRLKNMLKEICETFNL